MRSLTLSLCFLSLVVSNGPSARGQDSRRAGSVRSRLDVGSRPPPPAARWLAERLAILEPVSGQPGDSVYSYAVDRMILGGIGLGSGGLFGGAILGAVLWASVCRTDDCYLVGAAIVGGCLGTAGMAYGVHLGNDRRGDLGLDLLAGFGVLAAGVGAVVALSDDPVPVPFAAVPIVQLVALITVETSAARSRVLGGRVSLRAAPGGLAA